MRVFVDTNIWLDVILSRSADAGAFLLRCANRNDELWTAWHTLSNVDYILGRAKLTRIQREQHMHGLLRQSRIVATDEHDALFASALGWTDFEDALQLAAAQRVQADVIVTGNTRHFTASPIPTMTAAEFLLQFP